MRTRTPKEDKIEASCCPASPLPWTPLPFTWSKNETKPYIIVINIGCLTVEIIITCFMVFCLYFKNIYLPSSSPVCWPVLCWQSKRKKKQPKPKREKGEQPLSYWCWGCCCCSISLGGWPGCLGAAKRRDHRPNRPVRKSFVSIREREAGSSCLLCVVMIIRELFFSFCLWGNLISQSFRCLWHWARNYGGSECDELRQAQSIELFCTNFDQLRTNAGSTVQSVQSPGEEGWMLLEVMRSGLTTCSEGLITRTDRERVNKRGMSSEKLWTYQLISPWVIWKLYVQRIPSYGLFWSWSCRCCFL